MDDTSLAPQAAEYFVHIRIITGMIISLSMSRVLLALVHYVQFPKKYIFSAFHFCWLIIYSLYIIDWWWDVLTTRETITFSYASYLLSILYSFSFYFGVALITPTELPPKMKFDQYFMNIKGWFYGIFITSLVIDLLESRLLNGQDPFTLIEGIFVTIIIMILISAMISKSFKTQKNMTILMLIVQILNVAITLIPD